jgi:hypothetical protein
MEEKPHTIPLRPIIYTAIGTAVLVSTGWAWAWRELSRLHTADYEMFNRRIESLDAQLQQQLRSMRELIGEYRQVQDARMNTELEAARFRMETEHGRRQEEARIAELEERLAEYARASDGLESGAAAASRQAETLRGELDAAKREIDRLRRELAKTAADRLPVEKPAAEDRRGPRLESLRNAVRDRPSSQRREILVNVIPTIPEGITARELHALLNGMDDKDLLAVIAAVQQHVRRPIGEADLQALTGRLAGGDAASVRALLSTSTDQ